jgi:hypothetical protein
MPCGRCPPSWWPRTHCDRQGELVGRFHTAMGGAALLLGNEVQVPSDSEDRCVDGEQEQRVSAGAPLLQRRVLEYSNDLAERDAVRPGRISLARAHPASMNVWIRTSGRAQIPREGQVHRDPVHCGDVRRCSEQPTRAGSNIGALPTLGSSSPGTRAGSCRSRARRSHSPWGSRTVRAAGTS